MGTLLRCNSATGAFTMASHPFGVPDEVYDEVHNASRLFGQTPGELLARAWEAYRQSPEFREDFTYFQKAFSVGDINAVTGRLRERQGQRAGERARVSRAKRGR